MKDNRKLIWSAANHCRHCRVKADFERWIQNFVFIIRVVPRDKLSSLFWDEGFFVCIFKMDLLDDIVVFYTLLIGAEGARLLENANAFPSCVGGFQDVKSMSCGSTGPRRLPGTPAGLLSAWSGNQQPNLTEPLKLRRFIKNEKINRSSNSFHVSAIF
ncbi:hypothetical protein M3226_05895 [Neobacillus cucumis]|uniref:hypothetical protein n=1 Tax=Neobacillus cucumis TaxID=1740721 RepID=UPI00204111D4|nr:hypothetical protein [Neobacillus cucumis]MCM3725233.1 hypothetical protein [Neobacillus cucumis]